MYDKDMRNPFKDPTDKDLTILFIIFLVVWIINITLQVVRVINCV